MLLSIKPHFVMAVNFVGIMEHEKKNTSWKLGTVPVSHLKQSSNFHFRQIHCSELQYKNEHRDFLVHDKPPLQIFLKMLSECFPHCWTLTLTELSVCSKRSLSKRSLPVSLFGSTILCIPQIYVLKCPRDSTFNITYPSSSSSPSLHLTHPACHITFLRQPQ